MAAIPSREVTTTQISAVSFGFYTKEEVRHPDSGMHLGRRRMGSSISSTTACRAACLSSMRSCILPCMTAAHQGAGLHMCCPPPGPALHGRHCQRCPAHLEQRHFKLPKFCCCRCRSSVSGRSSCQSPALRTARSSLMGWQTAPWDLRTSSACELLVHGAWLDPSAC